MTDATILLFQISGFVFALVLAIMSLTFLIVLIFGAIRAAVPSSKKPKRDRQITKEINDADSLNRNPSRFNYKSAFTRDYERGRHPGSRR